MSDTNFSIEEELSIILLKAYELDSHMKNCHAYIMKWNPTLGEFLKAQLNPENKFDKFAVADEKCNVLVCTFIDSKKLVQSFFVEAIKTLASLQVTRKKVNLGEGFQIPFKLHFTRDAKCIDKIYLFFLFSPIFVS